jgi:hypothetical protein
MQTISQQKKLHGANRVRVGFDCKNNAPAHQPRHTPPPEEFFGQSDNFDANMKPLAYGIIAGFLIAMVATAFYFIG